MRPLPATTAPLCFALVLVLLAALGCGAFPGAAPPTAPPPAAIAPPPEPTPAPTPAIPALPVLAEPTPPPAAPTREQAVAAYVADCGHIFPAAVLPEEAMSDPSNECLWMEFDQNCGEDPSGCWDRGQTCQSACGGTCAECQTPCVATCDTCKTDCAGDAACVHKCAEARADCRDACLTAKTTCVNATCPTAEKQCYADFEAKKDATCPHCAALSECMTLAQGDRNNPEAALAACHTKLPEDPPECWDYCFPGW